MSVVVDGHQHFWTDGEVLAECVYHLTRAPEPRIQATPRARC